MANARILIVDDVPKNLQLLGSMLRDSAYEVAWVNDGRAALEVLAEFTFDLVLLDIMMPGMNGLEVCRRIRKDHDPDELPIIFLTAVTDKDNVVEGLRSGAQDYVTKPFHALELLSRIETQLELQRNRRELASLNAHLESKVAERTRELAEANRRIENLDEAKTSFLGMVNHELRTPLNGIVGITRLLEDSVEDENRELVDLLHQSVNRLHELSEAVLLVTQLRADAYRVKHESFRVNELIEMLAADFQLRYPERGFCCRVESTALLQSDATLLQQAVMLLLDNAARHSDRREPVEIHVTDADENVCIQVRDRGPGFTSDQLNHDFLELQSADIMHHERGLGLGLPAVLLIMRQLGGSLKLGNRQEGGATIRLFLPRP